MKLQVFEFESIKYTIIIGQNKLENFKIIDDSNLHDIWFHIEGEPSCHIILKNNDEIKIRDIPRQVIKRCAYLCKINSKAKTKKKCSIIYTQLENVVKTDIIGQVAVQNYKSVEV
jgi:predicted ribosome quality control (RQC) complex YloA/Tae2 family protein